VPELLDSPAFQSLNGTAVKVLLHFMRKRVLKPVTGRKTRGKKQYIITNNGEIVFTYLEAEEKLGISRSQFRDALDVLMDRGFIELSSRRGGQFGNQSLYALNVTGFEEDKWREWIPPAKVKANGHNPNVFKPGHPFFGRQRRGQLKKIPSGKNSTGFSGKNSTD